MALTNGRIEEYDIQNGYQNTEEIKKLPAELNFPVDFDKMPTFIFQEERQKLDLPLSDSEENQFHDFSDSKLSLGFEIGRSKEKFVDEKPFYSNKEPLKINSWKKSSSHPKSKEVSNGLLKVSTPPTEFVKRENAGIRRRSSNQGSFALEAPKILKRDAMFKESWKNKCFISPQKDNQGFSKSKHLSTYEGETENGFSTSTEEEEEEEEDIVSASWVDNLDMDMASFNSHRERFLTEHVNMDERSDDDFLLGLISSDSSVDDHDNEQDDVDLIGWECFFDDSSDELNTLSHQADDEGDTTDEETPELQNNKLLNLSTPKKSFGQTPRIKTELSESPNSQRTLLSAVPTPLELSAELAYKEDLTSLASRANISDNSTGLTPTLAKATLAQPVSTVVSVASFELDPRLNITQPKPPVMGTWAKEPNHLIGIIDGKHSHSLHHDKFDACTKGENTANNGYGPQTLNETSEEPSLDDILDTSLLQPSTQTDLQEENSVSFAQEDNSLSRWEKIPIGTFRKNQYIKSMARRDELIRDEWFTLAIKTREKRRHKINATGMTTTNSVPLRPKSRKARRALKKKARKMTFRQMHSDFQSALEDEHNDGSYLDNDYETVGLGLGPELSPLFEILESSGY
ncbi:transcriptional coactivator for ribosomal proteins via TOR signaling pathway Ifh1 [Schizosaccharomyces pombe]|uniref:Uncharacterized protein C22H10.11c n=1 Tax=Schizosaccharomyces pombe (strain 972 / ATCC 24843) TaxID=284812 RepID=YD4B_SCHPO|nr:putative TOR signaling pathway transcriptional corepressor Crf1 [Schizosaccharomyces pombe]Q10304.1 RecName: Full=Uncharacterized protein C22H10.11c [Schizosaccharomyces pombe 972h-]CAA93611.1 TOR signaling pathway transcriptional corepressor Crf1 (predicted) [Schizosaccharomyces pombe]|eukprot:NP_593748.1 putative TOR signaling pathway transcriptional corepressor Crf1 [Schizosaccharomyces pombe]